MGDFLKNFSLFQLFIDIALIIFIFGVLFESKSHGMQLLKKLLTSRNLAVNEHEKLSSQNIRITDV